MNITKTEDGPVHIHDASNYAREVLGGHGYMVSTAVEGGEFSITVRPKASLKGYSVRIYLSSTISSTVEYEHLTAAVNLLHYKITGDLMPA